jgi:hypothetical protein
LIGTKYKLRQHLRNILRCKLLGKHLTSASNREISLELGGKQFATAPIDTLKTSCITNEIPTSQLQSSVKLLASDNGRVQTCYKIVVVPNPQMVIPLLK